MASAHAASAVGPSRANRNFRSSASPPGVQFRSGAASSIKSLTPARPRQLSGTSFPAMWCGAPPLDISAFPKGLVNWPKAMASSLAPWASFSVRRTCDGVGGEDKSRFRHTRAKGTYAVQPCQQCPVRPASGQRSVNGQTV